MDMIIKKMKSGKKVSFVPLDSKMERMAAKKAGDTTTLLGQLTFIDESIRMTLREIDGAPCNYDSLLNFDQTFSMKEIRELRTIFNKINFDDEEEVTQDPLV